MMSSVIAAFRHSFHFYLHSARRAPYLYERRQRVPAARVTAASPCRPKWGGAASTRRRLSVARLSEAVTWWAMIIDSTRSTNCRMRRRMVTSMGHNDDVVADSNCVVNWWDVTTMLQSLPLVNVSERFSAVAICVQRNNSTSAVIELLMCLFRRISHGGNVLIWIETTSV